MQKIHSFKKLHIFIALTVFIVGAFLGIQSLKAAPWLTFSDSLTGMFPGIENNYASANFIYGGNNFAGLIFWTTPTTLSTPESISISGGIQSISCDTRINGIYYNNQRGWRIWPLDTGSLATLTSNDSGYNALSMDGGRYTNCSTVSGSFTPGTNTVFGQINHNRSGTEFKLIAGLNYDATPTTNSLSGNEFGNTLFVSGGLTGHMYDNYGGVAQVGGTGMGTITFSTGMCSSFITQYASINEGDNMNFTCYANTTGATITGYQLLIYNSTGINIYSNTVLSTGGSNIQYTGSALAQGNYTAECLVHGTPGGVGQCSTQAFTVTGTIVVPPFTGSCGLGGDLDITTVPGLVVQTNYLNYYYVRTTGDLNFTIRANQPSNYTITSSGITNTITGFYNGSYNPPNYTQTNTGTLNLSGSDGWQIINTEFSTGSCAWQAPSKWITVDLLPPSASTITSPGVGSGVCYVGDFELGWTGAVDSGVGITSYNYKIYSDVNFSNEIINESITGNTVSLNASQLGTGYFSGTYYRSIEAIDGLNQTGAATTGYFNVGFDYCTTSGNVMIVGTIPRLRNADLDKEYLSDPFTVYNLPGPVMAYVASGILYVNGTGMSNTGIIENGDELNIQYTSSSEYDTTVSTVFYIADQHATFYITTKALAEPEPPGSGCDLDIDEKIIIMDIFDMIKDSYDDNESTLADFLFTMESMIEDELGFVDNCSLEYLLDLTSAYIMDNQGEHIDESEHEAPNCKLYDIDYSDNKEGYTSSDLRKKTYFASRDALTRYIDVRNPGDCRINDYNELSTRENDEGSGYYIALNGKIYDIKEKTVNGTTLHYSPDFIRAKNFENRNDLYNYIDKNNPVQDIRNHDVDTDFDPMTFAAPNGKEYRIYHTDRGYMSYKLMKIQYFNTFDGIKNHITINNR